MLNLNRQKIISANNSYWLHQKLLTLSMTKWWSANYFIPSKILSVYIRDRRLGMRWNRLTNVETKILSHFTGGRGKYTNKEEKVWIMCNWWQTFSQKTLLLKKSFDAWNTTFVIKYILYCSSQHMDCVDGCDVTVPGGLWGVDSVTMHSVLTGDINSKSIILHGNLWNGIGILLI